MTETPQPSVPEPAQPLAPPPAPAAPPQYAATPAGAPYGAPTYAVPPANAPVATNTLAIIGLVASIVGFVWILPLIGSVAGVILAHQAKKQIKVSGEGGTGLATAAQWIGWIGIGLFIIGAIGLAMFWGLLFATSVANS